MQSGSFKSRLIAAATGVFLAHAAAGGCVALAQGGNSSLTDDRPVTIERKQKPRRVAHVRKSHPRAKPQPVEQAPLLSLQWRVLKLRQDGSQEEINPIAKFFPGDLLRLAVRTNQDGYLYIIHQKGKDLDGQIIFPDSRINDGQNYVTRNQEFIVPSNCPTGPNQPPCALPVLPPAGQEFFTLIFSRDMLLDLPNKAAEAGGAIKPEVLQQVLQGSGQKLVPKPGTSRYALKIINVNNKDNEEIIYPLILNKGE